MEHFVEGALKRGPGFVGKPESKAEMDFAVPRIMVIGAGGGGCNSINRLARAGIKGAELVAVNTDQKHLSTISESAKRLLIGASITKGLGAGGYPEIGAKAAEVSRPALEKLVDGVNILFITCGMGGGTGTGSVPIIAQAAKKQGAIVIAIVTYPFALERARLEKADLGIEKLKAEADTIIVIDNNRLVQFVPNLPIDQAFNVADEIIYRAVRGIAETILQPSLINLDLADVQAVMTNGGVSMIAVGEAKGSGSERVQKVVESTLHHTLLDVDYAGAGGVMIHITGGPDMTLGECNAIGEGLTESVDPNAHVIWGARVDPMFEGKVEALAIFTGIKSPYILGKQVRSSRSEVTSRPFEMPSGASKPAHSPRGEEDIEFLS
jgi:cell division protein FtsZ